MRFCVRAVFMSFGFGVCWLAAPGWDGCGPVSGFSVSFSAALLAAALWFGHRFHHAVEAEAAGLLARREFAEALQPLRDVGPGGREREHAIGHPLRVANPFIRGAFEGIHAQVFDQGHAQLHEGFAPHLQSRWRPA